MKKYEIGDLLYEDLIFINLEATNKEQLIRMLSNELFNNGYVKEGYANDVIDRENKYPTALPTQLMSVAIPHAENDHNVHIPAIVVAKLAKPLPFFEMGGGKKELDVSLVCLLAVKGSKTQLSILPKLISIFSDSEKMEQLSKASTPLKILDVLQEIDNEQLK